MASILIVETDSQFARRLSWILLEAGYDVAVCNSPAGAAECLDRGIPDIVVIGDQVDSGMMDRYIALFSDRAPAAGLLDLSRNPVSAHGRPVNAHAHLRQPFDADDLLEEVYQLLARSA